MFVRKYGNLGSGEKSVLSFQYHWLQSHDGFRVSWKQYLNLRSRRWLRPNRKLVRRLIPYGSWILKILFAQGRIKFSRSFLKSERLPEFVILQSRLFHSDIVEGKNEFLNWLCLAWTAGILLLCLVSQTLFKLGIKSNRYDGDFSFSILQKWQSFLNQRLNQRDSNLNSRQSFSDDILLIAPVVAR